MATMHDAKQRIIACMVAVTIAGGILDAIIGGRNGWYIYFGLHEVVSNREFPMRYVSRTP